MARGGRSGSEPGSAVAASGADPRAGEDAFVAVPERTGRSAAEGSVEGSQKASTRTPVDERSDRPAGEPVAVPAGLPADVPADVPAGVQEDVPDGVLIEVPEPARRVRRPLDRVRLLAAVLALGVAFLVGAVTVNTVAGLEADVDAATRALPRPVLLLVATVSGLLLLALPVAIAIDLLVSRRLRTLVDGLLAFAAAVAVASALRWLLTTADALAPLAASLTGTRVDSPGVDALTAGVIALATVAQIGQRPRWRLMASVLLALYGLALVPLGPTVLAVVVSMLIGRVVGLIARYAAGTTPSHPGPRAVVAALARADVPLVSLRSRAQAAGDPSLFDARHADGRPVVVHVLDRDHEGAGVFPALWRTLRLREGAGRRRALVSLRRAVEHEALVSMAMASTGARVQRLLAAVPVEPAGAALAFEDVPGPTLEEVDDAHLDDARLDAVWGQLTLLHRRSVAHRALSAHNVVLTPDGGAGLRITPAGLVAASETVLRLDVAQLLVSSALQVGPERAVASAGRVLGSERLALAAPLLQPVALLRSTRRRLRGHRHLLDDVRARIVEAAPSAAVAPVTLERLRPRTVVSAVALTIAAYVLVGQVAGLDLVGVVRGADWPWLAVAAVFGVFRYTGAALGLLGFVTERLSFLRTLWVQVAASFLGLVAPAGVGGAAVNVRYLQRAGVPAAAALATVAVWQLGTTIATVVFVVVVAVFAGNLGEAESITVPSPALAAVGVALGLAVLVVAVPPGRRFVVARLRPYTDQVVPRLGAMFSRPWRLLVGVAGALVQAAATVLVMIACIEAFGGSVGWPLVTVVVLAGTAVGSAAPTPGGLGAVEAVLSAGLTAGGLDGATAVSAVLLFRLLTFWLPVLPGWVAFTLLQRAERI